MPNSLPNNATVELITYTKIGLWTLDLLWGNMPISIKIKVWIKNLNVSGIVIIVFETKTRFFIKIEFNGHVTCSFSIWIGSGSSGNISERSELFPIIGIAALFLVFPSATVANENSPIAKHNGRSVSKVLVYRIGFLYLTP